MTAKKENKPATAKKEPQTVAGIPVATPEQQAAAEAAAQAAARKEQDKIDAQAQKLQTATTEVTTRYGDLQTEVNGTNTLIGGLTETSTLEDVQKAMLEGGESVKRAKLILKDIKKSAGKVKDDENLKQAVASSQTLVDNLETNVKGLKTKVEGAKAADKANKKALKEQEKADAKAKRDAEREANAMPEQNGVRRPKPDTLCGKAWELCDAISAKLGSPAPISYVIQAAEAAGLNEGNVRAEYARWKKFNGVEGRVSVPLPKEVAEAAASVAAAGKTVEAGQPVSDPVPAPAAPAE
ncbi:transcriptional activator [Pantoea phage vB_PagS_Vid5]|uniref:Transcriptional activator n=1 Tax=Pantoea phage vB_PagS_Vid5 TaxID=2099652 RepID=A0A2P1CKL8_9CAUD|nr:transcriptional activator [Pantoea phage vB_PagS_Vid5]AVJ51797.1 transcriptional activator [Pantoea phage vB_PagS_Vid5]